MDFSRIMIHRDKAISKSELSRLPAGFEPTPLGYSREGELAHYRGPNGLHVHEFRRHWLFHRDHYDPRTLVGAIGHAIKDAPEVGIGVVAAALVGAGVYNERKSKSDSPVVEALIAAGFAGLVAWGIAKLLAED
jgi:hypothetical protein